MALHWCFVFVYAFEIDGEKKQDNDEFAQICAHHNKASGTLTQTYTQSHIYMHT